MQRLRVVVLLREAGYNFPVIRSVLDEMAAGRPEKAIVAVEKRREELTWTSWRCIEALACFQRYVHEFCGELLARDSPPGRYPMGRFSIAYPRVPSFLRNHCFSSSFGDETVSCSRVTPLLFPRVAQRVLSEQRFGLRAFFAALPFTSCRGICDPLTAKNRSIERACEDTSAQKCISLRNPWE
jgi:hypothetical protein